MKLLAIETSTEYLSLALGCGDVLCTRHILAGQRHAELVLDAIASLLNEAGLSQDELQGIAYGRGPGSFTGLRIACGVTQGLALALDIPVHGVITLEALAQEAERDCGAQNVIACIDARMGEVYHGAYRRIGQSWTLVSAPGLYRPDSVPGLPEADQAWVGCGSGFAAYGELLAQRYPGVRTIRPDLVPHARAQLQLARPVFEAGLGVAAAEAVPLYLRDKVALSKIEQQALANERNAA